MSWVLKPIRCNKSIILKKLTHTKTDKYFLFKWELKERKDNRKVCLVMCFDMTFGNEKTEEKINTRIHFECPCISLGKNEIFNKKERKEEKLKGMFVSYVVFSSFLISYCPYSLQLCHCSYAHTHCSYAGKMENFVPFDNVER